jgi:hypothetical protein
MLWLVRKSRNSQMHAAVARFVFLTAIVFLVVVWTMLNTASYEARHSTGGALAVLPLLLESAWELRLPKWRIAGFATLIACGLFYLAVPLGYGVVAAAGKIRRQARQTPGPSRIYNPLLAGADVGTAVSLLQAGFDPARDIWYVTDPISALDLPGRVVIRHADFLDPEQLRRDSYRSSRPVGIRLVIPAEFERNGKGDLIRRSFIGAQTWRPCPTDSTTRCFSSRIAGGQ